MFNRSQRMRVSRKSFSVGSNLQMLGGTTPPMKLSFSTEVHLLYQDYFNAVFSQSQHQNWGYCPRVAMETRPNNDQTKEAKFNNQSSQTVLVNLHEQ